jgi:hypothetical protein
LRADENGASPKTSYEAKTRGELAQNDETMCSNGHRK